MGKKLKWETKIWLNKNLVSEQKVCGSIVVIQQTSDDNGKKEFLSVFSDWTLVEFGIGSLTLNQQEFLMKLAARMKTVERKTNNSRAEERPCNV